MCVSVRERWEFLGPLLGMDLSTFSPCLPILRLPWKSAENFSLSKKKAAAATGGKHFPESGRKRESLGLLSEPCVATAAPAQEAWSSGPAIRTVPGLPA